MTNIDSKLIPKVEAILRNNGGLALILKAENMSDEKITFQTPSSKLFNFRILKLSNNIEEKIDEVLWSSDDLHTMAVERWSVGPGETIIKTIEVPTLEEAKENYGELENIEIDEESLKFHCFEVDEYDEFTVENSISGSNLEITKTFKTNNLKNKTLPETNMNQYRKNMSPGTF